jgi:hypothetical protein
MEGSGKNATARVLLVLCAAFIALASTTTESARGQDAKPAEMTRFSCERELSGFETAQFSDAADLYDFAEYRALDGKEMTREEVDAVVAKWRAERERVTKEVAQLAVDPALRSKRRLHKRLASHTFLSRLELVENDAFAPVLFAVQRPPKSKPGFEDTVVQKHGPWARLAVETFEAEFKDVLPPRREGCALLPVIVLASWGDFVNYCQTVASGAFTGAAHFNTELGAVVVYAELMGGQRDEAVERRGALYGLIHELIQAHAPDDSQAAAHWWLREGLARTFSNWSGDAKAPRVAGPDERGAPWLFSVAGSEPDRERFFMTAPELFAVKSANDIYVRMHSRLGPDGVGDSEWGARVRSAFVIESGLLVADLLRADGGAQRAAVTARLASIVAPGKAAAAPPPIDPVEAQKRIAVALQAECRRAKLPEPFDDTLRAKLENFKPANAGAGESAPKDVDVAKTATGLTGSAAEVAFAPAQLLAEPLPAEARLGIALRLAGIGEFDAAAASCEPIEGALDPGHPLRERVVRETRRLRELAKWRLDFVEQWKAGGKKLRIEHDGAATTGMVKQVDEGDLILLDAKGRDLRIALAALDCEQILRRAADAKLEPGTPALRAYAALIAGRKSWSKGLGATPEELLLKSDGAGWPALLAKGEAAARLQKLAHLPLPANSTAAAAPLVELHGLLAAKGVADVVEPRRELLCQFATTCLRRQFDAAGIAALELKGRVLPKPDGTVRVVYDFSDPAQAEDWFPSDVKLMEWSSFQKLDTKPEKAFLRIEGGTLRGIGVGGWLTKLQFRAPMTVRFRYANHDLEPDATKIPFSSVRISMCDDGDRSRINSEEMSGLRVFDAKTNVLSTGQDKVNYEFDTFYPIQLVHDGKFVKLTCPHYPDRTQPCGARQWGHCGVWIYSDALVEVDDVEIEGKVDAEMLAPARDGWVDAQLAALEKSDWKPVKTEKPGK